MYEPLRRSVLSLLHVPAEPHPPAGNPASLRVFRAGQNFYRLRMFGWAVAQLVALAGIVFWAGVLMEVEHEAHAEMAVRQTGGGAAEMAAADTIITPQAASTVQTNSETPVARAQLKADPSAAPNGKSAKPKRARASRQRYSGWSGFKRLMVDAAMFVPPWVFPLVWVLKIGGFVMYLVQIPITYAVRRLDYEMRWYLVTDRSLRLRHGVWVVSEATMSFANVQQVVISQGPLQRLLGLADVKVQSAGGGSGSKEHQTQDDMHTGRFHCVTNAEEIRDLILERLRRFRESGLGDPDEKPHLVIDAATPSLARPALRDELLVAAQELALEAKALRAAVGGKAA